MVERRLPPQPTGGRACSHGDGKPSEGWRWYKALGAWAAVCHGHSGGTRALQIGDFVPDIARVERAPSPTPKE